jgi:hypothetical protein
LLVSLPNTLLSTCGGRGEWDGDKGEGTKERGGGEFNRSAKRRKRKGVKKGVWGESEGREGREGRRKNETIAN